MSSYSLTQSLVSSHEDEYTRATHSEFVRAAANGEVTKAQLGAWYPNHRIYLHTYVKTIGRLMNTLDYPDVVAPPGKPNSILEFLDWIIFLLYTVRREEKTIVKLAAEFNIRINHDEIVDGRVPESAKHEGLRRWEAIFNADYYTRQDGVMPWLEAAIVFWLNEKLYLENFLWAKSVATNQEDPEKDADEGVIRKECLAGYTCKEFVQFVKDIEKIIDDAVEEQVEQGGENVREQLFTRAQDIFVECAKAAELYFLKSAFD